MFLRFTMLNSFPHLSILPDCRHEVDVDSIDGYLVQYQFACHFVVDFSHLQGFLNFLTSSLIANLESIPEPFEFLGHDFLLLEDVLDQFEDHIRVLECSTQIHIRYGVFLKNTALIKPIENVL